jgi:hypothetical protein
LRKSMVVATLVVCAQFLGLLQEAL